MADISITPANIVQGGRSIRDAGIAGEPIEPGDVVYRDAATGRWFKASHVAEAIEARTPDALALNGAATDQPLAAILEGELLVGPVLTSGGTYYLSDTPGKICLAIDLDLDEFVSIVGMARSGVMLEVKFLSAQLPADADGGVPANALKLLPDGAPLFLSTGDYLILRAML